MSLGTPLTEKSLAVNQQCRPSVAVVLQVGLICLLTSSPHRPARTGELCPV